MKLKNRIALGKACKHINVDIIQVGLALVVLLIAQSIRTLEEAEKFIDITLFTSLFIAFCAAKLASVVSTKIKQKLEDSLKLETNYNVIIDKYSKCKMMHYTNSASSNFKNGRRNTLCSRINNKQNEDKYIFPITDKIICFGKDIIICDNQKQYNLPSFIADHIQELMEAHKASTVYNQLMIRLDEYTCEDSCITLKTSRTNYYDSLVTNRAMDYMLNCTLTVRDLYCIGPFFPKLSETHLSNHIGFSIFLITSDEKIIFIFRNKKLSIAKSLLGLGVSAALKTKYALDENGSFTLDKLSSCIKNELKDEFGIDEYDNSRKVSYEFDLKKNFICIYRDIVEGGKPQLLFYINLKKDWNETKKDFKEYVKNNKSDGNLITQTKIDGMKLIFIDKQKLNDLYIAPDIIVHENTVYPVMPSTSACVAMLCEYFNLQQYGPEAHSNDSLPGI